MRRCVSISLALVVVTGALVGCRPPGWGRGDDPVEVDAAVTTDGGATDADAAATTCTRAFRLEGYPAASSVWLTGSFNTWAANPPEAIELGQGADGAWTGNHTFAAGLHQYKFIVSGATWIPDPMNPDAVDDGFGSQNSLYTCVP